MKLIIENSRLDGVINAIPSKSYAHRIAICNFLAGNPPVAECGDFTSQDITATERCLKALKQGERVLDCGESGSTLRFMLPLCAVLGGEYEFIGHGKLLQRPNQELFEVMNAHGVKTEKGDTIKIQGKLSGGDFRIRGDISSQYVSGLLMALPYLNEDSKIVLTTPLSSAPYVNITLEVLKAFGVNITTLADGYFIKGNSKYSGKVLPQGDWSNMAFFLVAGAINGKITVKGLDYPTAQGDSYIVEILKRAGVKVSVEKEGVTVTKSQLKSFTFDAESCPDLVPITAVLASYAKGDTVIKNVERLKIKESDRITSTMNLLANFGIKSEFDGKNLKVFGGTPVSGQAESFNDHRIAMSTAILALSANGRSILSGAQSVNKSYPNFFEEYKSLGGKISEHV